MYKENSFIADKWKQYEDKKERKEQLGCVLFGVLFITLFFTMMALKGVYGY